MEKNRKIEKYLDFAFDKVFDALQNPVNIIWKEKSNAIFGTFFISEREYSIKAVLIKKNVFKFKFYSKKEDGTYSTSMTGLNTDVYRVIPTIKNAMIYLIENYNPNGIMFGATDNSDTRKKMYTSFSEELEKKYLYNFYTKGKNNITIFLLYKNLTEKDIESCIESGLGDLEK